MELPVHIQRSRRGDGFVAFCPDLPGCSAVAATENEAVSVLRSRIGEYFARGTRQPLPPDTRRTVIEM